jgi:poly-gamma-glutamate capsule biosynthesis protein CapA/YwtB (metallophosphatase superfamily)
LRAGGVRVVGIVNGHTGDLGDDAVGDTIRALRRDGMLPAGGPAGPAIFEAGGLRIVVTAHDLTGGFPLRLDAELSAAAGMGDVLVATFHVGSWFTQHRAAPELERAARIAVAAGARVIASHGTHEVAGVERRGQAVIAWGLGNLVFVSDCTREPMGAILRVWVPRRGRVRAALIPVDAGLGGSPAQPAADPESTFQLLRSVGSKIRREGPLGWVD